MNQLNLQYLQAHLKRLDILLHSAVQLAQQAGFDPDNEFQGLFVSEDEIQRHLSQTAGTGLWGQNMIVPPQTQEQLEALEHNITQIEQTAHDQQIPLRLLHLKHALDLNNDDLNILLVALAPAIERRYERIYGFLQDDVTKRRPTVNLVLNLLGTDWEQRTYILSRLTEDSPLVRQSVVSIMPDATDLNAAFANQSLNIDTRIVQFIQGVDSIPRKWQSFVKVNTTPQSKLDQLILTDENRVFIERDYGEFRPIFHLFGNYGSGKRSLAESLAYHYQIPLLIINLQSLQKEANGDITALELAIREGRLLNAVLMLTHWETVLDTSSFDPPQWLWEMILDYPQIVVLSSKESFEPRGTDRQRPLLRLELEIPDFDRRLNYWQQYLNGATVNPSEIAYKFKLTRGQIRDAVYTAYDLAMGRGETTPSLTDLYAASRSQSNRKLSSLAVKIKPRYGWNHIILPDDRIQQLQEICDQVRHAVQVYERWGFQGRGANAQGVTALFAGQSGTGKTMAAEIIAYELGLELFKIDLSSVVSKYIGETEKNLAAIFDEATQSNAILFFDEADALFGKRSEVKDSHDRYANIEIGYLLQRMETYDGVAILASNLRQNLDEAFTRRLDFLIDFPFPEEDDREKIWRISFAEDAPLGDDVDIRGIAERYRLAGGNIRNAALAAAFLAAADESTDIHMQHLIHAIRREHQKMGKLMEDEPDTTFMSNRIR